MAVVTEVTGIKVSMKLNEGMSDKGTIVTSSNSLAELDIDNYTPEAAWNIVQAAKPILDKDVDETLEIKTSVMSSAD